MPRDLRFPLEIDDQRVDAVMFQKAVADDAAHAGAGRRVAPHPVHRRRPGVEHEAEIRARVRQRHLATGHLRRDMLTAVKAELRARAGR